MVKLCLFYAILQRDALAGQAFGFSRRTLQPVANHGNLKRKLALTGPDPNRSQMIYEFIRRYLCLAENTAQCANRQFFM
jgi:hypothetical protein